MEKKPLFRKVNTLAHGVSHNHGSDYKRSGKKIDSTDANKQRMKQNVQRGLDYTPLFKFLLSKVGCKWNKVFSEASARLDKKEPIFWIVALHEFQKKDYVLIGESSYFSGLFVAEDGTLQIVNPNIGPSTLEPHCRCCTHTFNGVRRIRLKWNE
ncbi:hypothetical protein LQR30_20245 [Chromobacterium piscinae]|uniref:hypothetical protein n=1 Tax=Chromobacterium piscinae TaxID=686831 RepID=UPI001E2F6AA2|nr:hypothetical protein [Chromobacterium piscinae]MCD4506404.1 hypothetical protein [Chromobacterium piscinae]